MTTEAGAKVAIGGAHLTIDMVDAVARRHAVVEIDRSAVLRVQRAYDFVKRLATTDTPVYGLTTGCGPLASQAIPPPAREQFQRNLVRSHAVTLGAPHSTAFVRAAMAVRAQVFAQGYSGVEPGTVDLLVAMLNAGIHPLVREVGGVGASGDLVELAQMALALLGEGSVEFRGAVMRADAALHEAGLTALVPRYREGLALMNGTSFHTGTGAVLVAQARRLMAAAQIAAAMIFDALRGNLEAFAPELQRTRPHHGQRMVAERITHFLRDSALVRGRESAAERQDAYSLRCIPQVLGPVVDAIESTAAVLEIELNSVSDNPLFLVDEGRVVHGGNFHGQPVAMALDQLKVAMVELGVMAERRIARVLDVSLNAGLPPFLIRNGAGLQSGFMGLQYCASSMAADNAVLAAPASVHSVPTNANNQDVVSMGMVVARQAARVIDNVERMIAIELLCAAQALDIRGPVHAGAGTRSAHALIRDHVAPLIEDRPISEDVDAVCALIDGGGLGS
ncbi:MAG: aromatic amino acid lyase [Deltaproteobacteria bacterium]|nr:aromatic amino acid lyase [Deltaproteobacteria bacterium]MBI3386609.1 aromatic amino acid lyase [Deltaproteobacteria bacterium]